MTSSYDLVIHQDQWVRQITIRRCLQYRLELLLNFRQRGIKVRHGSLIPINAREIALDEACGLLRRPTWPSTPRTDFVPTMSQHNNLNLLANCLLHNPLLVRQSLDLSDQVCPVGHTHALGDYLSCFIQYQNRRHSAHAVALRNPTAQFADRVQSDDPCRTL